MYTKCTHCGEGSTNQLQGNKCGRCGKGTMEPPTKENMTQVCERLRLPLPPRC